jgi:hypothetical protein
MEAIYQHCIIIQSTYFEIIKSLVTLLPVGGFLNHVLIKIEIAVFWDAAPCSLLEIY